MDGRVDGPAVYGEQQEQAARAARAARRNVRRLASPAPSATQLASTLPLTDLARPMHGPLKPQYDALDEESWLETKFERSGAAHPAEGDLTVVIEYCYNGGGSSDQMSTKHGEERYHEEAELVARYFKNYYPGTTIFVLASDFRQRASAAPGTRARLGAFEIDARMRVDGQLVTCGLWSKLRTGKWPLWPDWQDGVREMVPVFSLRLCPCVVRADGTVAPVPSARIIVDNHDGSKNVADAHVAPAEPGGEAAGLLVRLLRGTYTVRVPQPIASDYFELSSRLTLTRAPLPRDAGPVELRVPLAAKPKLRVVLHGPFAAEATANLGIPFCQATLADVRITVTDRSPQVRRVHMLSHAWTTPGPRIQSACL